MSSKHNHMVRSHRSEHRKATAFGGFKPAVSPNRNKYATQTKLARGMTKLARGISNLVALFKKSAAKSKARAKRESAKKGGSRL